MRSGALRSRSEGVSCRVALLCCAVQSCPLVWSAVGDCDGGCSCGSLAVSSRRTQCAETTEQGTQTPLRLPLSLCPWSAPIGMDKHKLGWRGVRCSRRRVRDWTGLDWSWNEGRRSQRRTGPTGSSGRTLKSHKRKHCARNNVTEKYTGNNECKHGTNIVCTVATRPNQLDRVAAFGWTAASLASSARNVASRKSSDPVRAGWTCG